MSKCVLFAVTECNLSTFNEVGKKKKENFSLQVAIMREKVKLLIYISSFISLFLLLIS